jgi:3-oxoacyl-[acyl-carrier protein] reductase
LILTPERDLPVPIQDRYLRFMASPRPGRPTDIAEMVAFLASDAAEYVTGQTINVDGGVVAMNAMSMERWG